MDPIGWAPHVLRAVAYCIGFVLGTLDAIINVVRRQEQNTLTRIEAGHAALDQATEPLDQLANNWQRSHTGWHFCPTCTEVAPPDGNQCKRCIAESIARNVFVNRSQEPIALAPGLEALAGSTTLLPGCAIAIPMRMNNLEPRPHPKEDLLHVAGIVDRAGAQRCKRCGYAIVKGPATGTPDTKVLEALSTERYRLAPSSRSYFTVGHTILVAVRGCLSIDLGAEATDTETRECVEGECL